MTEKFVSLHVDPNDQENWQQFGALLREYAENDLAEPHLSSIWKDLEDLHSRYSTPFGGGAILLKVEDVVVGCMAYATTKMPDTCEVKRLYVRRGYRRRGYAEKLMREIFNQAREAGYAHAALSTWPDNPKALDLYQKLGFQPVAPFKDTTQQALVFLGRDL